ncbi:hypothetical protein [Methylobacterium sp. GXF4]|uniref:hypothetical protein n=1 Tax=Methylobacterium sp. GXF4 TaxID=1096546 RepID=UPI000FFF55C8|nr:hypothetical protein [Methylobacterium sp. GXF4]
MEELRAGLGAFQDRLELSLNHIAPDGPPVARAAFVEALVVGMALALAAAARGPAGSQGAIAVVADHEAAQREIDAEVGAVGRAQAVEPVLDALMRLQADEGFMVALAASNVPLGRFDVARIDRVAEHIAHALMGNLAVLGLGIGGMLLQEANDIGLGFKPA